jgi:1-acyl-sn-glycerol-3-phosphate acyltransferase
VSGRRRRRVPVPPRLVRRLVLAPALPLVTVVLIVLFPLSLPLIAFATRYLPGRLKALSLTWVLLVWLVRESVGVLVLFSLWVLSGFGWHLHRPWFRRQHVRLLGWYLWGLVGTAQRTLGLRLVTEESPGALVVEPHLTPRPVLVFSRHAGAGDSFLLAHELVNTYGRVPSIVLKEELQLDPCIDIALNRLPNRFIAADPPPGADVVSSIGQLAAELPADGALVLFPEGGNFTERRRRRAIERLEERGLHDEAAKARALRMVLPPRPGGTLAALAAAPGADVVFVAHTGLERLSSARQVLEGVPMEHSVRMAWWFVPVFDVPTDEDDRISWLADWWARIDGWIERHAEAGLDPATPLSGHDPMDDEGAAPAEQVIR